MSKNQVNGLALRSEIAVSDLGSGLNDQQLLSLCVEYGSQTKLWRQKFLGLLPEVERRNLFLKKGCASIFEFASKFGGVSREQVLLVLRLDRRFQATPQLQKVQPLVKSLCISWPEWPQ